MDELCILNIDKHRLIRGPNFDVISRIASETFIPISYGGGVSELHHFEKLFQLGVEKVIVNSLFWTNRPLIKKAVNLFGSQAITLSIDLCKRKSNFWSYPTLHILSKGNGDADVKEYIPLNAEELVDDIISIRFGEVFITDINREGTYEGLNTELCNIFSRLRCPIVLNGGLASEEEIVQLMNNDAVTAISGGSLFSFSKKHRGVLISYPNHDELNRGYYD